MNERNNESDEWTLCHVCGPINGTTWPPPAVTTLSVLAVSVLALPTNLLVVLVVQRTPALHTNQGTYMVSLAMSELLTGLMGLAFSARYAATSSGPADGTELDVGAYFQYLFITMTLINTISISLDKLHQIAAPYSYNNLMTRRTCRHIVLGAWITLSLLCFLPTRAMPIPNYFYAFSGETFTFGTVHKSSFSILILIRITLFILLLAILMVGYGIIFCISRGHHRRMSRYSVRSHANENEIMTKHGVQPLSIRARFKGSLTIALIVAAFLVLWAPFFALKAVQAASIQLPGGVEFAMNWLAMTHTSINVIIYGGTYKPFKKGLRNFLGVRKTNYYATNCDIASQQMTWISIYVQQLMS